MRNLILAAALLATVLAAVLVTGSNADADEAPPFSYIDANGISFAYVEIGEGPLVLLLHGYPETSASWWPVQQKIAAAGYRAVAPNMRGYRPTSIAEDGDYTVGTLGADALALVEALGETQAVIVGHDWGSTAAMAAAVAAPDKVNGLVSLAIPHPVGTPFNVSLLMNAPHFLYYQLPGASWWVARNDFAHVEGIYEAWSPTFDQSNHDFSAIKESMAMEGGVDGPLGYYWSISADPTPGTKQATAETLIDTPALIISGDADGAIDVSLFADGAEGFTGPYTYVELADVGHFPQLEAPDAVSEAILEFLATVDTGR